MLPERAGAEARTAALLPCLLLARIDGKSPVEYLDERNRGRVRRLALELIAKPPGSIAGVINGVAGA